MLNKKPDGIYEKEMHKNILVNCAKIENKRDQKCRLINNESDILFDKSFHASKNGFYLLFKINYNQLLFDKRYDCYKYIQEVGTQHILAKK